MARICNKCILPDNIPNISFDKAGICNFCRNYSTLKKKSIPLDPSLLEQKMLRLLKVNRKKYPYDCLCLYSGGKDSTFMLYQLVKKYKLRVLAVTLDNYFLAGEAHENIKRIIKKIEVDHIFCRPDFGLVKELIKASINESHRIDRTKELSFLIGFVCWPCFTMIGLYALKTALKKNIPNIVIGTTPGQLRQKRYNLLSKYKGALDSYRSMSLPMLNLLRLIGYKQGQSIFNFTFREKLRALKVRLVPFYEYTLYQEEKALQLIEQELDWQRPKKTDSCSTNCELNTLGIVLHLQRFNIHPYVIPLAHDIREGILKREDALKAVRELPNFEIAKDIAAKLEIEIP
jgi:hypothetical protein